LADFFSGAQIIFAYLTPGPDSNADAAGTATVSFRVGDAVLVKAEGTVLKAAPVPLMTRRPHLRCPGYVHGAVGVVEKICGIFVSL
jgi:hypothetical protein